MSMRRENGRVLIDISEDDWSWLMIAIGHVWASTKDRLWLRLVNSLNEGNPTFTPYEIPDTFTAPDSEGVYQSALNEIRRRRG